MHRDRGTLFLVSHREGSKLEVVEMIEKLISYNFGRDHLLRGSLEAGVRYVGCVLETLENRKYPCYISLSGDEVSARNL